MRASRLLRLLGLLQTRGLLTAAQLATELEVSQRTVLRDIEALSSAGIPVYAVRGKRGGFQLVQGYASELPALPGGTGGGQTVAPGPTRARIRLSPRGRRMALLLGRPPGIRVRRSAVGVCQPSASPDDGPAGWTQAWIPVESAEATVLDLLALGAEVEVLSPPDLRERIRRTAAQIAALYEVRLD